MFSQASQTASANESDRTFRQSERLGDLFVRAGRGFKEKHMNQLPAARGQLEDCVAQYLFCFEFHQHLFRKTFCCLRLLNPGGINLHMTLICPLKL